MTGTLRVTLLALTGQIMALSRGEATLLRLSILVFTLWVAFCIYIVLRVREVEKVAKTANDMATVLDERTATLKDKLNLKE